MWRNWAGDQACTPATFERPAQRRGGGRGAARAAAGAGRAGGRGRPFVHPRGAHRRHAAVAGPHGPRARRRPLASGLVRVQAGITLGALSDELWRHGAGVREPRRHRRAVDRRRHRHRARTAPARRLPNLSAALHSIELVTRGRLDAGAERGVATPTPGARRACRWARSGVVTAVTLRPCRRSRSRATTSAGRSTRCSRRLDELADGHRALRVLHLPLQRPAR